MRRIVSMLLVFSFAALAGKGQVTSAEKQLKEIKLAEELGWSQGIKVSCLRGMFRRMT